MKYGILKYSRKFINLGDQYQLDGIRYLYKRMGISEDEIIEIDRDHLAEYEGEYVVLPMTGYFSVVNGVNVFPLPERIIPVFVGFHCIDDKYLQIIKNYGHWGPFGCRDEVTMKKLRQNGLDAYMSGCLSICGLERRQETSNQTKVFLVDVEQDLMEHIPEEIKKDAVRLSQVVYLDQYKKEEWESVERKIADEQLARYRDEAKLVITSRMHCALPCLAMGIPTIMARKYFKPRISGLDKILTVYNEEGYDTIDYNLPAVNIDDLKEKTLQLAEKMIREKMEKYSLLCDLSGFYEDRKERIYYTGIKDGYLTLSQKRNFYEEYWNKKDILAYISGKDIEKLHLIVYGAGDKAMWMYERYREKIKKFKSVHIVDEKKNGENMHNERVYDYNKTIWGGIKIEDPAIIKKFKKEELFIIVAAHEYWRGAGRSIGNRLIDEYGLSDGKEFFFLDKLNNSMVLPMDECGWTMKYLDGF